MDLNLDISQTRTSYYIYRKTLLSIYTDRIYWDNLIIFYDANASLHIFASLLEKTIY